jgi:hypothetical protein
LLAGKFTEVRHLIAEQKVKFPGQGQSEIHVLPVAQVPAFLKLAATGLRLSLEEKQSVCGYDYLPVKSYIECDLHAQICRALAVFDPIMQYTVNTNGCTYRIDMYFARQNAAVECDEYGHHHYSKMKEAQRTADISAVLGCKWIRYNPHDSAFNVFDLIASILKLLITEMH